MMSESWHIREAQLEDANSLRQCMALAYASYQDRMGARRLPPMDLDYTSEIADYPTWVVECESGLIGGIR